MTRKSQQAVFITAQYMAVTSRGGNGRGKHHGKTSDGGGKKARSDEGFHVLSSLLDYKGKGPVGGCKACETKGHLTATCPQSLLWFS
jgi:hypothetical protein